MKAWEIVNKLCSTSTGDISFHIYNKEIKQSEDVIMDSHEAIIRVQSRNERTAFPFGARVETIVLIDGRLHLNCTI